METRRKGRRAVPALGLAWAWSRCLGGRDGRWEVDRRCVRKRRNEGEGERTPRPAILPAARGEECCNSAEWTLGSVTTTVTVDGSGQGQRHSADTAWTLTLAVGSGAAGSGQRTVDIGHAPGQSRRESAHSGSRGGGMAGVIVDYRFTAAEGGPEARAHACTDGRQKMGVAHPEATRWVPPAQCARGVPESASFAGPHTPRRSPPRPPLQSGGRQLAHFGPHSRPGRTDRTVAGID